MSVDHPQWVVVDDTDTDITYTGQWFQDQGSQDSQGNYGPAYRSTLHGVTSNASLSYAFSGSRVRVFGTTHIRNDSGVIDPSWECFVDHISIGATNPFPFRENNWVFCGQNQLVDGPHILTVNATVINQQTFWFDAIQYVPSENAPLDKQAILVDSLDPQLQYGPQWQALGGTANMTTQTGSTFSFDFHGVSLSWYGFIPTELPHAATTGTYSIDGQPPVSFLLKGLPPDSITIYNQKFFETPTYPAGQHRLSVVYQGNGQTTPLTLDYLIIQNGSAPSTSSSGPSPTNGASGGSGGSGGKSNIGAIVGGVVGGLAFILLGILAFFFLRRRKKRRQAKIDFDVDSPCMVEPFQDAPVQTTFPPFGKYASAGNISYPYTSTQQTAQVGSEFLANSENRHHGHGSMPSYSTTELQSVMAPSSSSTTTPRNVNANTATYTTNQPMPNKTQREAQAAAPAGRPRPGRASPLSDDTSRIIMHEDSGIRLPGEGRHVVEVPPMYTPG